MSFAYHYLNHLSFAQCEIVEDGLIICLCLLSHLNLILSGAMLALIPCLVPSVIPRSNEQVIDCNSAQVLTHVNCHWFAGFLWLVFVTFLRCCCTPVPAAVKQPQARAPETQTFGAQYPPRQHTMATSPPQYTNPAPPFYGAAEGAQYNPQSNQFIVNGRVYGTYVGNSPRAYSPRQAVPPSAPPYR